MRLFIHLTRLTLALLACIAPLRGAELIVDGAAQSPGTGAPAKPFQTIGEATAVARPGDSILIRAGTYRESVVPPAGCNGTAGARITLRPFGEERVVVSGTDLVPSGGWQRVGAIPVYFAPWTGDYVSVNNQSDQVFANGRELNLARWPEETNHDLSRPHEGVIHRILSTEPTDKDGCYGKLKRITFTCQEWNQPDGRMVGAEVFLNSGNSHADHDGNGNSGTVIATNLV